MNSASASIKTTGFDKAMLKTARIPAYVGGAALAAALLIICANIALRPAGGSIRGASELSGYICAMAIGLSLPFSQLNGAHIEAGLWNRKLPRRMRPALDALVNLSCAVLLAAAGREIYGVALYGLEMDDYIDGFGFSYFTMALALAAGLLLQALVFIRNLSRVRAHNGSKK